MVVCRLRFLTSDPTFRHTVLATLNSPDSWGLRVVEQEPADVVIGFIPLRHRQSRVMDGERIYFSTTWVDRTPVLILLDPLNYWYGVPRSGLSVQQYRQYLIHHEFGHAWGRDHLRCQPGATCPILYQMTRGVPPSAQPSYRVTPRDRQAPCRRRSRFCRERERSRDF